MGMPNPPLYLHCENCIAKRLNCQYSSAGEKEKPEEIKKADGRYHNEAAGSLFNETPGGAREGI
jgi:hypothetical protein